MRSKPPGTSARLRVDRRTFLTGGVAAAGGALAALGASAAVEGVRSAGDGACSGGSTAAPDALGTAVVPFRGEHQAGVTTPPQSFATFVAMDLLPGTDREALVRLMRVWTEDAERLTSGVPPLGDTEPELAATPSSLTVTVGFGPGLFDAAELVELRPTWLAALPAFAVDRLEDAWSGGDLALQVCANDPVVLAHAVRVLVKGAQTFAAVRWVQGGFRPAVGTLPEGTTVRNLMGQLDGTRNLVPGHDDHLIWNAGEPTWLAGGTSLVIRRIAMDLDTWDAVDRPAREEVIGRRLSDGAPLTSTDEHDEPDLDAVNQLGLPVIAAYAHIRRARSENPDERFLRRVYSYDDPPAPGALSNSGLLFATYQADVARQFIPIQQRLADLDLLNRWTTPVGSAVFAVPPGAPPGTYLGQGLLEG
jgi:dye decolorizing peroxidase